jgi:hypothetical protein
MEPPRANSSPLRHKAYHAEAQVRIENQQGPVRQKWPLRVKQRKSHKEQMSSGLLLKADIARCSRHVSKVPNGDIARQLEMKEAGN